MARVKGMIARSTNYEVTIKKPLDARSLVKTYEDLLSESNWLNGSGNSIAYNGMLVAVANTSDISKNGLYFLFDINCTTGLKSPDVTSEANWLKIGETSDIGDLAERISQIDNDLSSRIDALEEDTTHTYGYRKDFPEVGQQNHMYIANDEHRTYTYVGGRYLPIADQFEYTDHDDNPETPEVRIICGGNANY